MKVTEYIERYGRIDVQEKDGFRFWSDGQSRIGGRFKKVDGKVRCL